MLIWKLICPMASTKNFQRSRLPALRQLHTLLPQPSIQRADQLSIQIHLGIVIDIGKFQRFRRSCRNGSAVNGNALILIPLFEIGRLRELAPERLGQVLPKAGMHCGRELRNFHGRNVCGRFRHRGSGGNFSKMISRIWA